jgi:Rrf2 family protein
VKLSRESHYAILGLSVLASDAGTIMEVSQVAEKAGLPAPFLAKTFGKLTHQGILRSHRGKERGYSLARPASEVTLKEILEAVDGADLFERCIFWTEICDESNPCPLHNSWKGLKSQISKAMVETSLADIAADASLRL